MTVLLYCIYNVLCNINYYVYIVRIINTVLLLNKQLLLCLKNDSDCQMPDCQDCQDCLHIDVVITREYNNSNNTVVITKS